MMYSAYLSSDHLGVKSTKVKTYIFEVFVLLLEYFFFLFYVSFYFHSNILEANIVLFTLFIW